MNIQETLLYIRKKKDLPQRKLLKYVDSSVYSKIESGRKNLTFSELIEILTNLSIPLDEFSKYFDNNSIGKTMRALLEDYKITPNDLVIKEQIITYFNQLYFSRNMLLEELSDYIVIKTLFSNQWKEIPHVSAKELAEIFILLKEKKYYFHYDYAILSNTIYLFNDDQIEILLTKTFPVKDMKYRNAATKEFITNLICNLITTFIRKQEYEKCHDYIELAKKERNNYDLPFKIMLTFLENMIAYVQRRDSKSKEELEGAINFLNSVEEHELANALQSELENVLATNKEPTIILRNHFNKQY
ncbi:helix-turn-helix domain-containing protein [Enterococcus sp. AZ126]|uniref:helix-turn-helix domain-containing protein n=1 Tax=Enterococcus sp. AZ126 TaxID=2774635 RepID=UPI003F25FF4B